MASDWREIENDREKYAAYLCSREWSEKREKVRERSNNTCERCCLIPMDSCHHLTYERKYREELDDLQAICQECHQFTHGKSNFDPVANEEFIQWSVSYGSDAPWLGPRWKLSFLNDVFTYPSLVPVVVVWVSTRITQLGAQQSVDCYGDAKTPDGILLEDCGAPPVDWEASYIFQLPPEERSLFAWLSWGGPTQYPIGDRDAFKNCMEIAERLRKKNG